MEVSIYGTCYNNANVIRKSIDSIVSQFDLNGETELVITDNESTDGTWDILQDYNKKYKNVKLIRERCTRGKGRRIAYNSTSGKYTFYIDLDTVYSPILSKLIKQLKEEYKGDRIMPFGFMDRATMDKIGNWGDLNNAEDGELEARAISKGVTLSTFPAMISTNEITSGKRELRFKKRRFSFKFFARQYRVARDGLIGRGMKNIKAINKAYKGKAKIFMYFVYITLKLSGKKTRSYSEFSSSSEFIQRNRNLLDPSKYNIDKRYWIYAFSTRFISHDAETRLVNMLFEYGFNKLEFFKNSSVILYNDKTSAEVLENTKSLLKTI